ncbi:MAG: DMT family transporter, partial [Planctomycetota bacterium]
MLSAFAILSALAAAASWAVASVAIAKVLEGGRVSPAAANLFKNSAAAFCFLLGALFFGGRWPVGEAWAWLFLSGFLGFSIADTLYFAAFRRCGVQTAATVMLLNVPIATLLAVPLAGDEISTQVIPFIAVVLVGVILVILDSRRDSSSRAGTASDGSVQETSTGYGYGVLLAVVAAFAIGTAIPLGRGSFGDVSVCQGGFIRLVGGALGAVPIAALTGLGKRTSSGTELVRLLEPIFAAPGPGSVWSRASLFGVGCAVLGLVPYHFAQRELPSGIASTLFSSTPLFTLVLALVLRQAVGWKGVLGTVAGFAGVAGILQVTQAEVSPIPFDLGEGPEVRLLSQQGGAAGAGGARPSFVRSYDPSLAPPSIVALSTAPPVVATESQGEGALHPVLFESEEGEVRPRTVFPPLVNRPLARGHWADVPFALRLASRGLLVGTHQMISDEGLGYGVRLGLEADGPPGLDLGWLHVDESDVLHGFVSALPL